MEHESAEGNVQPEELTRALEALRVPLTGYCYRMIGAAAETDDAVQETIIRAHRALDRFDSNRSRLTTWVHRDPCRTTPRQLTYFGVDLTGMRLAASDCDFRIGTGREIVMDAADILLVVTGRRPVEQ